MSGLFMTDAENKKFDSWTKLQIYEAYLGERMAKDRLAEELKRVNRKLAEIKFIAGGNGRN